MYINKSFSAQTLTNAGTVTLNLGIELEDKFEGSLAFTAKGTKATGTFSASAQLQGSNDSAFANAVDIGAAVVMADTVNSAIPLSGTVLYYAYYRVVITGSGTQSTSVIGTVTLKGRD